LNALVVFHGESTHSLAWLLKPGFRHVLVCILVNGYWISVDPADGLPKIEVQCGPDFDLRAAFEDAGAVVVATDMRTTTPPNWPWALANCVGVVKAVLGIRAPFVITPYQLFKRLSRC
jgi:hypothetical protein